MVRLAAISLVLPALAGCSMVPAGSQQSPAQRGQSAPPVAIGPRDRQCLARLGAEGAQFSPVPDRYAGQGCAILGSVQLQGLASDRARLAVSNIGPVTCEVSEAFAAWARFGADRAAQQILGSPLRSIETFGSYSCRDVAGSGRRSAHAIAAAIDVSGFVLADGRRIMVKSGWDGGEGAERRFLRAVHESACRRFATVLGPEYNEAHRDHLHFEGVLSGRGYCR